MPNYHQKAPHTKSSSAAGSIASRDSGKNAISVTEAEAQRQDIEEAARKARFAIRDKRKEATLRQILSAKKAEFGRQQNYLKCQEYVTARAKEEMEMMQDHLDVFLRVKDMSSELWYDSTDDENVGILSQYVLNSFVTYVCFEYSALMGPQSQ